MRNSDCFILSYMGSTSVTETYFGRQQTGRLLHQARAPRPVTGRWRRAKHDGPL